jgi:vacuolar-type H+-ATPase subunit H
MSSKKEVVKEETITTSASPSLYSQQQEQEHLVNRALDQTKDNIRKATDEARNEIPRYTRVVNEYQEQTIQATREIADSYLDAQKQIINSLQSTFVPAVENVYQVFWNNWMSPRRITEIYAKTVSSFADNTIAVTRLANNSVFANMEAFKRSIHNTKDNAKEFSRIGINAAKTFEQTSSDSSSNFSIGTEGQQQQRRY